MRLIETEPSDTSRYNAEGVTLLKKRVRHAPVDPWPTGASETRGGLAALRGVQPHGKRSAETETPASKPANCGPLPSLREIFRFECVVASEYSNLKPERYEPL